MWHFREKNQIKMAAASTGWKYTFRCLHHYQCYFIIAVCHVLVLFFNILQKSIEVKIDIKVFFDTGQRFGPCKMFSQVSLYSPRLHLLDQKYSIL